MATISLKLELRKTSLRQDGTYPVKLYIEHKGSHPAINLKVYAKPYQWNAEGAKLRSSWGTDHMSKNRYLHKRLRIGQKVLDDYSSKLREWSALELRDFVERYIEQEVAKNRKHKELAPVKTVPLFDWLEKVRDNYVTITPEEQRKHIHKKLLRTSESWGQYDKTQTLINCLKSGSWMPVSPDIQLSEITVSWLELLKQSLIEQGMAEMTVQTKLKHLRACIQYILRLYKHETGRKLKRKLNFAFGSAEKGKFKIGSAKARKKRAISHDVLVTILSNPVPRQSKLFDQWYFALAMFNLNGMDYVDFARLSMEHLQGSYDTHGQFRIEAIRYKRKKCDSTNRESKAKEVYCPVNSTAATILWHYIQDRDVSGKELIFPVFKPGTDLNSRYAYVREKNRLAIFNRALRELALLAGYPGLELTSKVLRHTFATSLKRKGVSIYTIQEMLGHATCAQTEEYLAGVEVCELEQASKKVNIEIDLNAEPQPEPEPEAVITELRPAS